MSDLINQLKSLYLSFVLILISTLIILGILLGIHIFRNVPIEVLTNDVAVVGKLPVYAGALSQTGIFLWSATIGICLYSTQFIIDREQKRFIIISALITCFLAIDDAFMLHEIVLPRLGMHQVLVILSYGVIMLWYIFRFHKLILKTDFLLFVFALGWFAVSLFIDNFMYDFSPYISKLVEDIAKLIGIISWLVFFTRVCKAFQRN